MAFATVSDLSDRLGRDLTAETDQVTALLDAATAIIREACGGAIISPSATVTVPFKVPYDERWVQLPQKPVTAVSQVDVEGTTLAADEWELVDGAIYLTGRLLGTGISHWRDVEVTFTYGYATAPEDVKEYTLILASQMFKQAEDAGALGSTGVQSESETAGSWSKSTSWPTGYDAPSVTELPRQVMQRLASRYGNGTVYSAGSRWP